MFFSLSPSAAGKNDASASFEEIDKSLTQQEQNHSCKALDTLRRLNPRAKASLPLALRARWLFRYLRRMIVAAARPSLPYSVDACGVASLAFV